MDKGKAERSLKVERMYARLFFFMAAVTIGVDAAHLDAQETQPPKIRRWDDGPLQAAEFVATAPSPLPRVGAYQQIAWTESDLRFQLTYRSRKTADEVKCTLAEISIFAVFLGDRSWITRPDDAALLKHEQGHFDITELHAKELELSLLKTIRTQKPIVGVGPNENAACRDLERQILAHLGTAHTRATVAQQEYDRATNFGLIAEKQLDQSAQVRRQIELLNSEIVELQAANLTP